MKYLIGLFILFHMVQQANSMNEVNAVHDSTDKIDQEFENLYYQAQGKQFTVVRTTPTVDDLKEGEFVIYYSTNGEHPILNLRVGSTNYIFRSEPKR